MARKIYKDAHTGVPFTLPIWTDSSPVLAECAAENRNFREALELAPRKKHQPGAAIIRSLLRRYAVRWQNSGRFEPSPDQIEVEDSL